MTRQYNRDFVETFFLFFCCHSTYFMGDFPSNDNSAFPHLSLSLFARKFKGHSPELLEYLHETSTSTGDYQMKSLLTEMVDRKEVTTPEVLNRINFILTGTNSTKSVHNVR